MDEDRREWRAPHSREELNDPSNPPNSLLRRESRNKALMSYVAPIVILFVIVGIGLIYWANRGPTTFDDERLDRDAVGTVGRQAPAGFDPVPDFDDTRDELDFRGADAGNGGTQQNGPTLESDGRDGPATIMDVGAVSRTSPGNRVRLENVRVDAVDQQMLWIRDGDARVAVHATDIADVRAGDQVRITGVTERDDSGGMRIRASRVEAQ